MKLKPEQSSVRWSAKLEVKCTVKKRKRNIILNPWPLGFKVTRLTIAALWDDMLRVFESNVAFNVWQEDSIPDIDKKLNCIAATAAEETTFLRFYYKVQNNKKKLNSSQMKLPCFTPLHFTTLNNEAPLNWNTKLNGSTYPRRKNDTIRKTHDIFDVTKMQQAIIRDR